MSGDPEQAEMKNSDFAALPPSRSQVDEYPGIAVAPIDSRTFAKQEASITAPKPPYPEANVSLLGRNGARLAAIVSRGDKREDYRLQCWGYRKILVTCS